MTEKILQVKYKQNNSDQCIVCGKQSEASLSTDFYALEGDVLLATCIGKDHHQSYPERMHGGLITAILDESIGRAVQIANPDIWGVTSKIDVQFKKPVPLNERIYCYAKITKLSAFAFIGKGYIEDGNGTLLAVATATYVRVPVSKITGTEFVWELFPSCEDFTEVTLHHAELLED